jgi:peptidoglycan/LPS O-acetylase OafA/YrhL
MSKLLLDETRLISKTNNFDLIRFLAAMQVVMTHGIGHFEIDPTNCFARLGLRLLPAFPGVPIFFSISGFLILWSYERNHSSVKTFFFNRARRIFPGLWVCFAVTFLLLVTFDIITYETLFTTPMLVWIIMQLSFFQVYTPASLKNFGVGTPNGSLWTIPVELQFYCTVPLIYYLTRRWGSKKHENAAYLLLALVSLFFNLAAQQFDSDTLIRKLMGATVVPYLFYFVFGALLYKNYEALKPFLEQKSWFWLLGYLCYFLIFRDWLQWYSMSYSVNFFALLGAIILSCTTISLAFTVPRMSDWMLRGNDISYGIYIYHMLVINALLQLGYKGRFLHLGICLLVTTLLAYLSWIIVERRLLGKVRGRPKQLNGPKADHDLTRPDLAPAAITYLASTERAPIPKVPSTFGCSGPL